MVPLPALLAGLKLAPELRTLLMLVVAAALVWHFVDVSALLVDLLNPFFVHP